MVIAACAAPPPDSRVDAGGFAAEDDAGTVACHCSAPQLLDFCGVAFGDSRVQSFVITNPSVEPLTVGIGEVAGEAAFVHTGAHGAIQLAPGASETVSIKFTPYEARQYSASVQLEPGVCCSTTLKLAGRGVDSVLTFSPAPLDFGYVRPGNRAVRELSFRNDSCDVIGLTGLKTGSTEYRVVDGGANSTGLTVPPGVRGLSVEFAPAVLGPRNTTLTFQTSLSKQPSGAAQLKGYGGGPELEVTPGQLDFGKVAYFAGTPVTYQRSLRVRNVGTAANLLLGAVPPYVEIRAMTPNSSVSEIQIVAPLYDPSVGLEPVAGKDSAEFLVRVTPLNVSTKQWELTLRSNDPDGPQTVLVTAEVVLLPPCNYSVSPANLDFGSMPSFAAKDLAFTITNNGQNAGDVCLVSNVALAASSSPAFSVIDGGVDSKELQAQESLAVIVRTSFDGGFSGPNAGSVGFTMSSPTNPKHGVPLTAEAVP
jgi:hypothetical protein